MSKRNTTKPETTTPLQIVADHDYEALYRHALEYTHPQHWPPTCITLQGEAVPKGSPKKVLVDIGGTTVPCTWAAGSIEVDERGWETEYLDCIYVPIEAVIEIFDLPPLPTLKQAMAMQYQWAQE